jgi:ABC-type multidrug transport system fused ATPase/permease subunit
MQTYLRILSYAWRYPTAVIIAVVLSVVVALLYTAQIGTLIPVFNILFDDQGIERALSDPGVQPYLVGAARLVGFDESVLASGSSVEVRKGLFFWSVIGLITLLIVQHLCRFAQEFFVGQVVQRSIRDINMELYRKVIRQPVEFFRSQGSGDIVSRFTNDAFMVAGGMKTIIEKLIREPLKIVTVLAFALYLDAELTLLTFLCIPVAGGLAWAIGRKVRKNTRRGLQGRSRMIGLVREVSTGIRIVKVSRAEPREIQRFDDEAENIYDKNMRVVLADAAATPVMVSLTSIFAAAAIVAAGYKVFETQLTPGEFMAFYGAIFGVLDPVRRLSSIWNKIQSAAAGGERVFEFMDREPEDRHQPRDLPRRDGRAGGRQRCRQVDAGQSDPALLRPDRRLDLPGRSRPL